MRLIQISDCHLRRQRDQLHYGQRADSNLACVLEQVHAWQPDRVVATGDLADGGDAEAYHRLFEQLEKIGCPIHVLPGNHDDPVTMRQHLRATISQRGVVDVDPHWRLVMIDSHVPGQPWGWINSAELSRVDALCQGHRHVLAFTHHHPIPVGSTWADRQGLRNGPDLLAALNHSQVKMLAFGHIHHLWQGRHGRLPIVSAPSTFTQAQPGRPTFVDDDRPPGARWFELHPDGRLQTGILRAL